MLHGAGKHIHSHNTHLSLLSHLLQVVALITIEVHARDVIEKLGKVGCTNANDFEWVSQLRFYWEKDQNDCTVKQASPQQFFSMSRLVCKQSSFSTRQSMSCLLPHIFYRPIRCML